MSKRHPYSAPYGYDPAPHYSGSRAGYLRSGAPFAGSETAKTVSHGLLWSVAFILFLIAVTGFTLALITFLRTNDRHKGLSSRIHEARDASLPVGFSVYKNTSQMLVDGVADTVGGWSNDDGFPAYDRSGGAFDHDSGIFTTIVAAYYTAMGTICFGENTDAGNFEAHLMTNGTGLSTVYNRQIAIANATTDQCLGVHHIMWLPSGTNVWLMALSDTGANGTVVSTESQFAVERQAI